MALQLQTLALTGELSYIAKHNANYIAIAAAIDAVNAAVAGGFGATLSVGQAFYASFGNVTAVIGKDSYKCTGSGTSLTVSAGYAWFPSLGVAVGIASSTVISFASLVPGTYYISADSSGNPVRSTSSVNALYSVVWGGSSFGAITRLAAICWAANEWAGAQTSTALGATYESLDARLEAGEAGSSGGLLARTNQTGRLGKALSGASVTLTATEANNSLLEFTGALTQNIDVILPSTGPRCWLVSNKTTGNFRVTLKLISGAGTILPSSSQNFIYHDGTNVVSAGLHPSKPAILSLPVSVTPVIDFARADTVRLTLASDATATLTGAQDGQKCVLEITQDAAGGWQLDFGPEVNLGADIASVVLSSAPLARDRLGFIYNSAAGSYDLVAIIRGY